MIEWLNGKLAELTGTLQLGGSVMAIALVALAYWKTRTLVALLVAGLTAGAFIWLINEGAEWVRRRVEDETNEAHRVVIEHPDRVAVPGDPVVIIEAPDDGAAAVA